MDETPFAWGRAPSGACFDPLEEIEWALAAVSLLGFLGYGGFLGGLIASLHEDLDRFGPGALARALSEQQAGVAISWQLLSRLSPPQPGRAPHAGQGPRGSS